MPGHLWVFLPHLPLGHWATGRKFDLASGTGFWRRSGSGIFGCEAILYQRLDSDLFCRTWKPRGLIGSSRGFVNKNLFRALMWL